MFLKNDTIYKNIYKKLVVTFYKMGVRTVELAARYWSVKKENGQDVIYVSGPTEEINENGGNRSALVKIHGFEPSVFLELPRRVKWNKEKCQKVFEYLQFILPYSRDGRIEENAPTRFDMFKKKKFHYSEEIKTMQIWFKSQEAAKHLASKCKTKDFRIKGFANFHHGEFVVHEHGIDSIIKFTGLKDLPTAGWIRFKEMILPEDEGMDVEERKFSNFDVDMHCHWKDVVRAKERSVQLKQTYMCFDLECYSKNHLAKNPDPDVPENVIFHISCAVGLEHDPLDEAKLYLLTLHDPLNIKSMNMIDPKYNKKGECIEEAVVSDKITIIRFAYERDLLLGFAELISEAKPDIFMSYNGVRFDWPYIHRRIEMNKIYGKFTKIISRIDGEKAEYTSISWESSAYGKQVQAFFDTQSIQMDAYTEVERSVVKLKNYKLGYVSKHYLKEDKEDVSPMELFMLYKVTKDHLQRTYDPKPYTPDELRKVKRSIKRTMILRKLRGKDVIDYRKQLLECGTKSIRPLIRKAMWITGVYALKDIILPVRLARKLNMIIGMQEMANCTSVPMGYLHTRGQQIRVLSQVYRFTSQRRFVIPTADKEKLKDEQYEGATVIEANPGHYKNIVTEDFGALYPSAEIARNISPDTLLVREYIVPEDQIEYFATLDLKVNRKYPLMHLVKYSTTLASALNLEESDMCIFLTTKETKSEERPEYRFVDEKSIKEMYVKTSTGEKVISEDMAYKLSTKVTIRQTLARFLGEDHPKDDIKLVTEETKTPDEDCEVLDFESHRGCVHDKTKRKTKVPKAKILCGHYRHRFKKVIVHPDGSRTDEGLLPEILRSLLAARKKVKYEMNKKRATVAMATGTADDDTLRACKKCKWPIIEKGSLPDEEVTKLAFEADVLDAKQLAIKVSCNSVYGSLGAITGFIPSIPCAASTTAEGRRWLMIAIKYILDNYPDTKLVYGDSVVGETPILCRLDGKIFYRTIDNLPGDSAFVSAGTKEIMEPVKGLEVWSDEGFTPIKKIIRHKTDKEIFRVLTHTGSVDVTEDHSLLDVDANEVTPNDVTVGTELLHSELPTDPLDSELTVGCVDAVEFYKNPKVTTSLQILSIVSLGKSERYVYDLETKNHHFAAGVGKLVVHNTDSCMIDPGNRSIEEVFEFGSDAEKTTSHYLRSLIVGVDPKRRFGPKRQLLSDVDDSILKHLSDEEKVIYYKYAYCPVVLEFESVYGEFLLLTKKRYLCYQVNKNGERIGITKKGLVTKRRNNCLFLQKSYDSAGLAILDRKSEKEIMGMVYNQMDSLFYGTVPEEDLTIYIGVKDVMDYAKKVEVIENGTTVKRFVDEKGVPIHEPTGVLDKRLVYPNTRESIISRRMVRRSGPGAVPPNSRFQIIGIRNDGTEYIGERWEEYDFFIENRRDFKIDPLIYLETQYSKPMYELISVKYPKGIYTYEKPLARVERALRQWKQGESYRRAISHLKNEERRAKEMYSKIDAITALPGSEILVDALRQWFARNVLDRLYKQFKLTKRKVQKVVHRKLPADTGVALLNGLKDRRLGTIKPMSTGVVVDHTEHGIGKNVNYTFTIKMDRGPLLKNIPREDIEPYFERDHKMFENIIAYRKNYREVVKQIDRLFSYEVVFEGE